MPKGAGHQSHDPVRCSDRRCCPDCPQVLLSFIHSCSCSHQRLTATRTSVFTVHISKPAL